MRRKRAADAVWTAAGITSFAGMSLLTSRVTRSAWPFEPLPELGLALLAFAVLVLVPAAAFLSWGRRLGVWLGIATPDPPSGRRPDEDLRSRGSGGQPR